MADGTVTVTIYNFAFSSLGTITSAFLPRGEFLRNDAGDGEFVFPLYDTPARNLAQYNRIAVATVEDSGGTDVVVAAFHIRGINLRYVSSGMYDGYVVHVSGPGILHELSYDNLGYTTISNGSQGPTTKWFSDILAFAQNSWVGSSMGSLPSGVSNNAYLRTAGETVMDALQQAIAQTGRFLTYSPIFATLGTAALRRSIMFVNSPTIGSYVSGSRFQPLTLVKGASSTPDECTILDFEPIEETFEVTTRVTAYGAGIGADVLTIADAQGLVTVPTGFTVVSWSESIISNSALEAVSGQPQIHKLEQFGHIKSEDASSTTANETAAIQLFWASIYYLRDRQAERREYYRVTFIGWPGAEYSVGQLVRLTYSETSNIDGSGSAIPTNIIDVDDDFVIHELSMEVPNSGQHQGKRVITVLLGAEVTTSTYIRPLPTDDEIVVKKLKEHDEVLRHATAAASPVAPGGNGTYATADAPFLVLSNTTNLTNERALVFDTGDFSVVDGGANGDYEVSLNSGTGSLHAPVTLAIGLDNNLLALTGQQLGLDQQSANTIFAGPTSGGTAAPAFRAMVAADLVSHVLATNTALGGQHTISGATAGQVLRASGATTANFQALSHSDLTGVSANQHHNQSHVLATTSALGPDHTVSGLTARQVLIATGATTALFRALQSADLPTGSTLSVSSTNSGNSHAIASSSAVSTATATLLATDSNGRSQVQGFGVGTAAGNDNAVTLPDDGWIGLGIGAARIVFDNQTVDQIEMVGGTVLVNSQTPDTNIPATTTNHLQVIDADFVLSNSAVSTGTLLGIYSYGTGVAGEPRVTGRRARGTRAAPTAVQSGDILFKVGGVGYTSGGSFGTEARSFMQAEAKESWSATSQGASLNFYTTPTGGTSTTERMSIEGNGNIRFPFSTETLRIVDCGSTAATEQDWIEVSCNGVTGYIRVHASK